MPYVFGEYTLDTQRYELRREGSRLPLRPKVFQVLTYLIEQRHRVVTRDELLAEVWPNQSVGEETLTSCVKEARRTLGDSGQAQCVIQTVHGRGLRFVAEVTVTGPPLASLTTPLPPVQTTVLALPRPLVGREVELIRLHQWYATTRQGQRQVGFITGDPGIGKTAMVEAFVAQVAAEMPVWIGHGQCIEQYGPGEAYLPVLEALGRLCRGPEGAHFLAWLRQHAPSWLAQMPALLSDADRDTFQQQARDVTQTRMLRELAEAMESLTAQRPLILILEDLHWSDGATLEWLAYVARRRDPARLLVLGTYRLAEARVASHPLYPVTRELLVHGQGAELVLGALSVAEVATYTTQRFGEGPLAAALIPVLYQHTQGNPLFLVTMVDDLVYRGVLREGAAGWEHTAALDTATVGVPETLRHLVEQQFERLAPVEQALIEAASVAGVDFAAAAVAAGVGMTAEDVDIRCATLARQGQFVHPHGTATWPDGTVTGRYRFRHALYQGVVYARLPVGSRTRLHQQIGQHLETAYGEWARDIAAELAVHFDRGRDGLRAVQYRQQAAENALRRHGHGDAIAHCAAGLEVLATLPETPERTGHELALHTILGPALITARGYATPEVEQTYTRALQLCDALGEPPERFAVLFGLTAWHFVRGECTAVNELAEQLLYLAQRHNNPAMLVEAHAAMGTLLMFRGELMASWAHLEAGLALYDPDQHRAHVYTYGQDPGLVCLSQGVDNLWLRGYPDQALARLHAALELARGLSHPATLAYTMLIAALLHQRRRDVDAVRKWADAAITLATENALPHWLALGTMYAGWALAAQGRMAEGLAQIQQGLAGYRATGVGLGVTRWLGLLAEVYGRNGRAAEGCALFPEALAVAHNENPNHEAELYRIQGDLLAQVGGRHTEEKAEASMHQALAMARQQQARSLELRAAISLGRLWQHQGKRDTARHLLGSVYHWFTEGFDTADLQKARIMLDELHDEAPITQAMDVSLQHTTATAPCESTQSRWGVLGPHDGL
jgi:predicted ATPase/DNA-binding winged helix-turn-helix (wHTH) protein